MRDANLERSSVAIVDDDAFFCDFVTGIIGRNSRLSAFTASTWEGLCKIVDRHTIDCIVLDYDLGKEDGFYVMTRLRSRYGTIPPVVMLTGDVSQNTVIKALRLGINDYVPKYAMKPSALISTIERLVIKAHQEKQIAAEHRRMAELATRDSLTGLANRRVFDETFRREFKRAAREKSSLGLIMIDVDRFKAFNDRYGHPAGDECLRRVGAAIRTAIHRPGDIAARYGGEEFAVILPNTYESGAAVIAERIRRTVEELALPFLPEAGCTVTVSAGVAGVEPRVFDGDAETLLRNADNALYFAKSSGRNLCARASTLRFPAAPALSTAARHGEMAPSAARAHATSQPGNENGRGRSARA